MDRWYKIEIYPSECSFEYYMDALGKEHIYYSKYIVRNNEIIWQLYDDAECKNESKEFEGQTITYAFIGGCDVCDYDWERQNAKEEDDPREFYQKFYCEPYSGSSLLSILTVLFFILLLL